MECLICEQWAKMPYAKRWSTPTTVEQTEGTLVIGYWLGTRHAKTGDIVCERHRAILAAFDASFSQPAPQAPTPTPVVPTTIHQVVTAAISEGTLRTAQTILEGNYGKQPFQQAPLQGGPQLIQQPVPPPPPPSPPPKPVEAVTLLNPNSEPPTVPEQPKPQPVAPTGIDPTAMALEAAKAPPTQGVKVTNECPKCGQPLGVGELHEC